MTDAVRLIFYGLTSLALGFAVLILPSAGFLFRNPVLYGITDGQYGFLFLPMVATTIVTGFGYQSVAIRFGRHRVFCAGFVITGLSILFVLAAGFAGPRPTAVFILLLLSQALLGFGFSLLMSSVSVFAIELFPNHRTSILTAVHGMFGAGALLSPLVLDMWNRAHFWQGQVMVGFLEILIVGAAAFWGRATPASAATDPDLPAFNPIKAFMELPSQAKGFVWVLVLYGTVEAVVSNWSTIYLTQERGFSATTAAICLSLFWGFLTAGRLAATVLAVWIEPRKLFRIAPFVMMAGLLLLRTAHAEAQVFLPYMVIGLGCSYTFPLSVSLTTRYHESRRDVLPSFMLAGLMTGVGLGSSAIGFLRGVGLFTLDQVFVGAIAAVAGLCVIFFNLTNKPLDAL